MNISQIRSMTRAIAKAFSFYANDYVSYTSPAGVTTTNIRCFLHHPARVAQDSITVDAAGTRYYEELEAFFLLDDLGTIVIDPAGHFDIAGTRYDFSKENPVLTKTNPIGAVHNIVVCYLTKALETKLTKPVTKIAFKDN